MVSTIGPRRGQRQAGGVGYSATGSAQHLPIEAALSRPERVVRRMSIKGPGGQLVRTWHKKGVARSVRCAPPKSDRRTSPHRFSWSNAPGHPWDSMRYCSPSCTPPGMDTLHTRRQTYFEGIRRRVKVDCPEDRQPRVLGHWQSVQHHAPCEGRAGPNGQRSVEILCGLLWPQAL